MPQTGSVPRLTERSVLAQRRGVYTLEQIYAAMEEAGPGITDRDGGQEVIHGVSDTRWKRRVRGTLQTLKREGAARSLGRNVWILDGQPEQPRRAVLVSLDGPHREVELRLAKAGELLAGLDEPADLICCDPPYGLNVGRGAAQDTGARIYERDQSRVLGGYVDVPAAEYRAFTRDWVSAAAAAIRPGGYLAVVTGPQQAAYVQVAGEDCGLVYVNSISAGKVFALRTTRRFSHSHWRITVLTSGPLTSTRRVFTPPPDLPKARSGVDYPLDLWPTGSVGRADARPGELRYPNSLPVTLVDRLVGAFTREPTPGTVPDLVCDPFLGGGTTALVALRRGLRFVGGDVNPAALRFTAARLSAELADCNGPRQLTLQLA